MKFLSPPPKKITITIETEQGTGFTVIVTNMKDASIEVDGGDMKLEVSGADFTREQVVFKIPLDSKGRPMRPGGQAIGEASRGPLEP